MIPDGQVVPCDHLRHRAHGLVPSIYIFRWDSELYIKELMAQEVGGAIAVSQNPNPKYKPIEIPPNRRRGRSR